MALNTNFYQQRTEVRHNGEVACTVRGITPNDLAQVMVENASDLESVMQFFERDSMLSRIDPTDDDALATALRDNTSKMFGKLVALVPNLLAKIIAIASDEAGKWEIVRDKFVLPLQLNALTEIARLTFVDADGFKAFVGNVVALAENAPGKGNGQRRPALESEVTSTADTAG